MSSNNKLKINGDIQSNKIDINGNITSDTFVGNLNGNADSATNLNSSSSVSLYVGNNGKGIEVWVRSKDLPVVKSNSIIPPYAEEVSDYDESQGGIKEALDKIDTSISNAVKYKRKGYLITGSYEATQNIDKIQQSGIATLRAMVVGEIYEKVDGLYYGYVRLRDRKVDHDGSKGNYSPSLYINNLTWNYIQAIIPEDDSKLKLRESEGSVGASPFYYNYDQYRLQYKIGNGSWTNATLYFDYWYREWFKIDDDLNNNIITFDVVSGHKNSPNIYVYDKYMANAWYHHVPGDGGLKGCLFTYGGYGALDTTSPYTNYKSYFYFATKDQKKTNHLLGGYERF